VSIVRLQRRLKALGFYQGKITRDANKALTEAIRRYRESGLHDSEVEKLL
jgi:peptidoglycan hydrolase-like protein with peptidoglycan-binding domain